MRIDVKKYLFMGLQEDRHAFFTKAQELGIVHFIETHVTMKEVPVEIEEYTKALKVLRGLPVAPQEFPKDLHVADNVTKNIVELHQQLEKLEEERRILKLEISRVEIFGDFKIDDLAFIAKQANRKLQFFCGKEGLKDEMEFPPEVIYIGSEHGLDYFAAINTQPQQYPRLVEMKIDRSLGELLARQKVVALEINALQTKLKGNSKFNKFLHQAFVAKMDSYNLHTAKESARSTLDGSLFVVEGWVPVNKIEELKSLASDMSIHIEEVSIEPEDVVPTYLENKGFSRIGEDLVGIYDTPSITDKDPSIWVLIAFSLFFAFIVGDGGYGAAYLGLALYIKYKYPEIKGVGKRVLNLMIILCIACIAWGFLTTSFFGLKIGLDNPLRKISLVQWMVEKKTAFHMEYKDDTYQKLVKEFPQLASAKDPYTFLKEGSTIENGKVDYKILSDFTNGIMMELALFIGSVHVLTSLIRYAGRNLISFGWILFVIGGYLYFPYYLKVPSVINYIGGVPPEISGTLGLYLIAAGIPLAMILSIYTHGVAGIFEVMGVIQIFADILSYLRLYALGLAGAIMGETINSMAEAIPFAIAFILMLSAHFINMVLGVMSGVIHGLRLNFLEWYHYSFEGGGKKFRALKLLSND